MPLLLSLLVFTLGGLTKLQFLVVGFPMGVFVLRDAWQRRLGVPQLALLAAYAVVAVGVPLAWYAYAPATPAARTLLTILLIQPLWTVIRVDIGRWMHPSPDTAIELLNPGTRAELEAATPAGALCLVGPDESGCRQFYFLHKKGFSVEWLSKPWEPAPNGQPYVADCIARGTRYLYLSDTTAAHDPRLQPYLARSLRRVGSFGVWELRPHPALAAVRNSVHSVVLVVGQHQRAHRAAPGLLAL